MDEFNKAYSRLQWKDSYDKRVTQNQLVGAPSSNHPLGNDSNGSCYWAEKGYMDSIWTFRDSNLAEHELGFKPGSMYNQSYYRIDVDDLSKHNGRIASGYELGANEFFTGNIKDQTGNCVKDEFGHNMVDPQSYNKMTSGNVPEAVSDQIPLKECTVFDARKFNDPNEISGILCKKAESIKELPAETKDKAIERWNTKASALSDRISGEQDYLKQRIQEHQKRMSQFPEGHLEHSRAKDNKEWCENYHNQLEKSKQQLMDAQKSVNPGQSDERKPVGQGFSDYAKGQKDNGILPDSQPKSTSSGSERVSVYNSPNRLDSGVQPVIDSKSLIAGQGEDATKDAVKDAAKTAGKTIDDGIKM